jgi:hypothetical protein
VRASARVARGRVLSAGLFLQLEFSFVRLEPAEIHLAFGFASDLDFTESRFFPATCQDLSSFLGF